MCGTSSSLLAEKKGISLLRLLVGKHRTLAPALSAALPHLVFVVVILAKSASASTLMSVVVQRLLKRTSCKREFPANPASFMSNKQPHSLHVTQEKKKKKKKNKANKTVTEVIASQMGHFHGFTRLNVGGCNIISHYHRSDQYCIGNRQLSIPIFTLLFISPDRHANAKESTPNHQTQVPIPSYRGRLGFRCGPQCASGFGWNAPRWVLSRFPPD